MLPRVNRSSGEYTSVESFNHLDDLIHHYRTVLELAKRYDLFYTDYFYHFWLRLRLRSEDSEIEFAAYDSWRQMRAVFDWLDHAADGATRRDASGRWELLIARLGDRIHFRETGVDRSLRRTNVAFPKATLLAGIAPLQERVEIIISRVVAEIGDDYWTDFRRDLA
ncbi:MAG: hypothetical protein AAFY82_09545 [Pseudomonadota bacterium]